MVANSDAPEPRAERLQRLDRLATFLDTAVRVPGTEFRIGADALLGLIPGIGDAATALIALYLVAEARRLGVSRWTLARMVGNVALDALVGTIPVAGDLFDAGFKANRRNMALLRRALSQHADAPRIRH